MWNLPAWQGKVIPARPAGERLRAYAGWCNAVEGNTTFYAVPTRETVAGWARQTAPEFRFVVKFPRLITHDRRFAGVEREVRAFLHAIEPLGTRAHAVWVQLPGAFAPGDVAALARFLARLPRTFRYAVEVRHPEFFTDHRAAERLERALTPFGAEWIPFDTTVLFAAPPATDAEREAWTRKPRLPRRSRALTEHPIVRYLGRDEASRTVEGWQPWVATVAGWLREGRSPTVFVHTPDNTDAPALARRFHDAVRAEVPDLPALPVPEPVGPPTLF